MAVLVYNTTAQTSSVSGGSLTWTKRGSNTAGGAFTIDEYYAATSSTLSSATITATIGTAANFHLFVFGVSGADTTSPFDANASLPGFSTASSSSPATSISTTNAADFIFGVGSQSGTNAFTISSPFTTIDNASGAGEGPSAADLYEVVSATQSSLSVGFSSAGSTIWGVLADAIVAGGYTATGSGTGSAAVAAQVDILTTAGAAGSKISVYYYPTGSTFPSGVTYPPL